jgi:hypothetical protein
VVEGASVIGAVTHKDADGDTLGSALALALALEPLGKSVPVVSSPPVPAAWSFLPGIERVNRTSVEPGGPIFLFDAGDAERAGQFASLVASASVLVNIDHHVTNTNFGTINLVCTDAASTGELVYDLLKAYSQQRQRTATRTLQMRQRTVWSLREAREELERLLGITCDWAPLDQLIAEFLVEPELRRTALASSFTATLEMAREGALEIRQSKLFAPLLIRRRERAAQR